MSGFLVRMDVCLLSMNLEYLIYLDFRISMLHPVDTRVQVLPQVTIPLDEVPAGRGHRALHLQTDLSRELRLGGVEESVRQEKLERSILSFKIFPCERSDTFFEIFVVF